MPICPECGNSHERNDEFCRTCGNPLPAVTAASSRPEDLSPARGAPHHSSREHAARVSPQNPPEKQPRKLPDVPLPWLAGGVLVLLMVIGAVWFFTQPGSSLSAGVQNASPSAATGQSSGIPAVNGRCSEGLSLCSGSCVDIKTDLKNCGGCGFEVPFGETCINGKFSGTVLPKTTTVPPKSGNKSVTASGTQTSCPSGQTPCSGTCRNLMADAAHCGFCGNACPSGLICRDGQCGFPGTAAPATTTGATVTLVVDLTCSGRETACGNACVNVFTDRKNCGVCGRACRDGEICMDGRCGPACAGNGTTLCDDRCIDLDTDMDNCGACGAECETLLPNAKGSLCSGGECILSGCKTDYADCDKAFSNGCEVYLRNDAANCGSCGNRCPSGQVCYNRKCTKPAA